VNRILALVLYPLPNLEGLRDRHRLQVHHWLTWRAAAVVSIEGDSYTSSTPTTRFVMTGKLAHAALLWLFLAACNDGEPEPPESLDDKILFCSWAPGEVSFGGLSRRT
jgi:hypothetical protein